MRVWISYLIIFGVIAIYATSPTLRQQSPLSQPFINQGITIEYDAAGNRIFRSKMPSVEINPDHYSEQLDTLSTGPAPGDGEVPGEDPIEP